MGFTDGYKAAGNDCVAQTVSIIRTRVIAARPARRRGVKFGATFSTLVRLPSTETAGSTAMMKSILVLGALVVTTAPAFADEYYVVRGPDKECRVVETRPSDSTIVQIGPVAFATRDEAERERVVLCEDEPNEKVIIKRD
jgi:hypothetical protein